MIWAATGMTFLATIIVCLLLASAVIPREPSLGGRLSRLWRPAPETAPARQTFLDQQVGRAQRVLTDLGKLLPASKKDSGRTLKILVRAGYRRPEVIQVMRGLKLLLPFALVALVYFTGVYTYSPVFVLAAAAIVGFLGPEIWLTSRVKRRQRRILLALPDALDLLVICVEAGLGLDQAIARVALELHHAHPDLSAELQLVNLEMRVGKSRIDALREVADRTGVEEIKTLVAMLIQTDRFGTDLGQALRIHADNLRTKRRQRAEEMAGKTTVKLVPPLVFLIFPALFVVLLGPAFITLVHQFLPQLNK